MDRPPPYGMPQELAPGIERIVAPNPSPMTHWGTNSYIVGRGSVAVVDPGPDLPEHRAALLRALGSRPVSHILVTHPHRDHSPLAPVLAAETGAPVLAFGPPGAGRSAVMQRLAATAPIAGGEGVDHGFRPDRALSDGETVAGDGWSLQALHTPGHYAGHLAFAMGDIVLTGDLVMGWASTMISPPDGDVAAFLASCARLAERADRLFLPGHGAPVTDPSDRLDWLIRHRRAREAQILDVIAERPATPAAIATRIYHDAPPGLLAAAERNVLAHLIDLVERGVAQATPEIAPSALYRLL